MLLQLASILGTFTLAMSILTLSFVSQSYAQSTPPAQGARPNNVAPKAMPSVAQLRKAYATKQANWPLPETADKRPVNPMAKLHLLTPAPKPEKVILGKSLFFDTQLSRNNTVSCASCHEPRLQFGDKRRVAIGIDAQEGARNTPNIFGLDHWESFFWDGRASSAKQQALMPIHDPLEMDLPLSEAVKKINNNPSYKTLIAAAFGSDSLKIEQLAEALVAFQRTISLPETTYSRFLDTMESAPKTALKLLSDAELKGLHLFRTKAKCMTCHQGALLSDNQFHVTGLHFYGRKFEDRGRYNVTKNADDVGKFRTASLLFVSHTGPWMHNGLFNQFDGIVNFYNNGGARPKPRAHVANDPLYPSTTDLLPRLELSQSEIDDLVAFLKIL